MTYKLFIDDERIANLQDEESMVIARDYDEAIQVMKDLGCPSYISFDHDLGDKSKDGYDIAKWMVEYDMDNDGNFIPEGFEYYIHSQNPIGKGNIDAIFNSYFRQKEFVTS